jgi:hypothetical protein
MKGLPLFTKNMQGVGIIVISVAARRTESGSKIWSFVSVSVAGCREHINEIKTYLKGLVLIEQLSSNKLLKVPAS